MNKAIPFIGLPAFNLKKKIEVKMLKTTTKIQINDRTPFLGNTVLSLEPDYSEKQFYADLRKSSKQLDLMVAKALEEHAKGKTREFPV